MTYVNDEEAQNTDVEMVFTETEPACLGSVWLNDIHYIMPTGRVCKQPIEGGEDSEGNYRYKWHIGIQRLLPLASDRGS